MKIKYNIVIVFLLISLSSLGQFNIQAGYDYGIIRVYDDNQTPNNSHLFNFIGEQKTNNWIYGLSVGIQSAQIDFDWVDRTVFSTSDECRDIEYKYFAKANHLQLMLSGGYSLNINDKSSIIFKAGYNIKHFLNSKVYLSDRTTKHWLNCPSSNDDTPWVENTKFDDLYKYNSFVWSSFVLSSEYRYQFNAYFLSIYFGYSPFQDAIFKDNTLLGAYTDSFIFGIRVGYSFPTSKNEN